MEKIVLNQLTVEVTRRCNMACAHCLRGDAENVDIYLSSIDEVLDQVEAIGRLIITGGEPTLNIPALQHIVNAISQRGIPLMRVQIISNGLLYEERLIAVVERFSRIIHLTQKYGYGREVREPWRVQIGISLDRYHAEPAICKRNYLKYRRALQGFAEVLRVSHGNAPRNEGRAKSLPDTINFDSTISTYVLQQVEVLSADSKPMCKFFDSYHLSRPEQKVICCGLYLNADGQILPGCACDTDYSYRDVSICQSWEPIWDAVLKYNEEHERRHCTFCDDLRTKINFMRPSAQAYKEDALTNAREAQDEPSGEPIYAGDVRRYQKQMTKWLLPDTYKELEAEAMAKDYFQASQSR